MINRVIGITLAAIAGGFIYGDAESAHPQPQGFIIGSILLGIAAVINAWDAREKK